MRRLNLLAVGLLMFATATAAAAEVAEVAAEQKKIEVSGPYRVVVFPFDAMGEEWPAEVGDQVADLVTARLSTDPNLELLERARLDKILEEHALGLTGMAAPEERLRVGRLSGAQFLVFGRIFPLDRDICLVAKIVSVETSKMAAVISQGPAEGELAELVAGLSGSLLAVFQEKAASLLPPLRGKEDVLAEIKKAVKDSPLPRVLVAVEEAHKGLTVQQVDPAVATELLFILKSCGFEVSEAESAERVEEMKRWAAKSRRRVDARLPRAAADVDVIILGEAVSEFGARRGELISCIGRIELQAVDADTGRVLAVARKTIRAVDLSETIAAKTALQEGAAACAASFVPWTVDEWVRSVVKEKTKR